MPDHASRSSLGLRANPAPSTSSDPAVRMIFDCPEDGTTLIRTVSGPNAPSTVEVTFEPLAPNDQLIGEPASWCNSPGGGQPLIFDVPAPPNPGDPDTIGLLKVRKSGSSAEAQIRVKIKHPS